MAVGTTGNKGVAQVLEFDFQCLCVTSNKVLVFFELGSQRLFESDGQSCNGMVMRATLVTGENTENITLEPDILSKMRREM